VLRAAALYYPLARVGERAAAIGPPRQGKRSPSTSTAAGTADAGRAYKLNKNNNKIYVYIYTIYIYMIVRLSQ
jgi:hypothetical protein